jgi:outer membrane protein W
MTIFTNKKFLEKDLLLLYIFLEVIFPKNALSLCFVLQFYWSSVSLVSPFLGAGLLCSNFKYKFKAQIQIQNCDFNRNWHVSL